MLSAIAPAIPIDLAAQMHQWIVSGEFRRWRVRTRVPDATPGGLGVRVYLHSVRKMSPCPECGAPVVIRKGRTGYCKFHAQRTRRTRETEFSDKARAG